MRTAPLDPALIELDVGRLDHLARREERRLLDDVPELAHVARPVVREEALDPLLREAPARRPVALRVFAEEAVGDRHHVLAPLAERRERDGEHVEAIVEVLAERAFVDQVEQIAVGRGDDPDVGLDLLAAADAGEAVGLEHAEQAHLDRRVHRPDLVEEDGAGRGRLELALGRVERAGERALLVAEELAADELLGDRAGVHGDERAVAAAASVVDRARDELLAGAALADDQDRRHRRGDALDPREDVAHLLRAADHPLEDQGAVLVLLFVVGLAHVVAGEELAHERDEAGRVERLLQIVRGAELERLDRARHGALPGDHDHRRRRREGLGALGVRGRREPTHQLDAGHAGEVQIGHQHVCGCPLMQLERLFAARGDDDVEPFGPQHGLEDRRLIRLVLDEEDASLRMPAAAMQRPERRARVTDRLSLQTFLRDPQTAPTLRERLQL